MVRECTRMRILVMSNVLAVLLAAAWATGQRFPIPEPAERELERVTWPRVTSRGSPVRTAVLRKNTIRC